MITSAKALVIIIEKEIETMSDITLMIPQAVISGIAIGFIYALIGIEYTLVYNVTGLVNYAHDKFISLGAFLFCATFVNRLELPLIISAVLSIAFLVAFSYLSSIVLFTPLQKLEPVYAITGTVMFGNVIIEMLRLIYGALPLFPVLNWLRGEVHFGNFVIAKSNIAIIIVSIIIVVALQFFLNKTKTGTSLRCIAQNKTATALMGINVSKSTAITMAISGAVCCVVGLLIVPLYTLSSTMAASIASKAFACGVIGGFGYLPGTIIGGIFLGIIEQVSTLFIPAVYKDCISFVFMMLILVFKPKGITGKGE